MFQANVLILFLFYQILNRFIKPITRINSVIPANSTRSFTVHIKYNQTNKDTITENRMLYLNLILCGVFSIPIIYEAYKYRNDEEFRTKLNEKFPAIGKCFTTLFLPNQNKSEKEESDSKPL